MSDNWTAYYILTVSEDGDIRVYEKSHDDAIAMLGIDENGEPRRMPYVAGEPWVSDPNLWLGSGRIMRCLIIKGEIVALRPVAVKYELA